MSRAKDIPTRSLEPEPDDGAPVEEAVLGLTIGWHVDVDRVGHRLRLPREIPLDVSRLGPVFLDDEGQISGPLADPYLSRRPVRFVRDGDGVCLEPGEGSTVRVDGALVLDPVRLEPEALSDGVVIELGERVVLILGPIPARPVASTGELIGDSVALQRLRRQIEMAAATDAPALLRGESGTGKELVARAIHAASARRDAPYQAVNLAAVPTSTAVAALFGHVRGAFTGADQSRPGYFGDADGGTLFLDEIGDASTALQPMLLRALETGEVQPVGDRRSRAVDVRIIAATDSDLEAAVRSGRFRLPLLHRLAGIEIHVPPLRTRRDDAARLLLHFLRESLAEHRALARLQTDIDARRPWLAATLVAGLLRHDWPGNVRELRNLARQMALGGQDTAVLKAHHAPALARLLDGVEGRLTTTSLPAPAAPPPFDVDAEDGPLTDRRVEETLRAHGWQTRSAARALGVPRTTLYRFIKNSNRLRSAADIPDDELRTCHAQFGGDLAQMADALCISVRALMFRLRDLDPPL